MQGETPYLIDGELVIEGPNRVNGQYIAPSAEKSWNKNPWMGDDASDCKATNGCAGGMSCNWNFCNS